MSSDNKEKILEIIDNSNQHEWINAANMIEFALSWWASSVPVEQLERAEALKTLYSFANPFEKIKPSLEQIIQRLLNIGEPGPKLEEMVGEVQKSIFSIEQEIHATRERLKPMLEKEESLRIKTNEFQALTAQMAELTRLNSLAEEADSLRQQIEIIEKNFPPEVLEAEELENRFTHTSEKIVVITEKTLAKLTEKNQKLVKLLEIQTSELKLVAEEVAQAQDRYKTVSEDLQSRKDVLELYRDADRIVADALGEPVSTGVIQLLNQVDNLLHRSDQLLVVALEANENAKKLTPIPYTSGGQ